MNIIKHTIEEQTYYMLLAVHCSMMWGLEMMATLEGNTVILQGHFIKKRNDCL
jgi:hypothetical protein